MGEAVPHEPDSRCISCLALPYKSGQVVIVLVVVLVLEKQKTATGNRRYPLRHRVEALPLTLLADVCKGLG